jgi:hypothetical protein
LQELRREVLDPDLHLSMHTAECQIVLELWQPTESPKKLAALSPES